MKMKIAILLFVVAIYFSFLGVECNINFSLRGGNGRTYTAFITELRRQLMVGTTQISGIPVLRHQVLANQRFLLINLINYNNDRITLGIDVTDVYVVGYLTGRNSYILRDAPAVAYTNTLFPGSIRTNLTYSGTYTDLERGGGTFSRNRIPLGLRPLDTAINQFFRYDVTPLRRAFLIAIQMVSEAARFRYIETTVASNLVGENTFLPDPAFLSLQNNWGGLSSQIQEAQTNGGQFRHPVLLDTVSGNPRWVTNVSDPVVRGVALIRYHQIGTITLDKEEEMHHVM